jgi:hypothetical protein
VPIQEFKGLRDSRTKKTMSCDHCQIQASTQCSTNTCTKHGFQQAAERWNSIQSMKASAEQFQATADHAFYTAHHAEAEA